MLGATRFVTDDTDMSLNIFGGESASIKLIPKIEGNESFLRPTVWLNGTQWDDELMQFQRTWQFQNDRAGMHELNQDTIDDFDYFGLEWSPVKCLNPRKLFSGHAVLGERRSRYTQGQVPLLRIVQPGISQSC